jgi:hypothetical protein
LGRPCCQVPDSQDHDESEAEDEHGQRHRRVYVALELGEDRQRDGLGDAPETSCKYDRASKLAQGQRQAVTAPATRAGNARGTLTLVS